MHAQQRLECSRTRCDNGVTMGCVSLADSHQVRSLSAVVCTYTYLCVEVQSNTAMAIPVCGLNCLKTLKIGGNQVVDDAALPSGIENLLFDRRFNQGLDSMILPSGLKTIHLGEDFDQSLDNTTLPNGLQSRV